MKRHVFSQLSCFKRESSDHIEQQQQILLHEIHIKVSFFYLTPLSESSMVLHTILLYTIYIGEFGSRWLLFIEAKLQQKRNNNAPPLVCSSAAHSSKQASKQSGRPSVRAYSAHWSETHQTTCATLLLHEQMASTNVEQNYDDRPPPHYYCYF